MTEEQADDLISKVTDIENDTDWIETYTNRANSNLDDIKELITKQNDIMLKVLAELQELNQKM